jgi:hypothetical protein
MSELGFVSGIIGTESFEHLHLNVFATQRQVFSHETLNAIAELNQK